MIPEPTNRITDIIQFIFEFDKSIFYNPLKFQGYIRDYYTGNRFVADDFIKMLCALNNRIENSVISAHDIANIRLEGTNARERDTIQAKLLSSIYIDNDVRRARDLEPYISDIYAQSVEYNKPTENDTTNSTIISFSWGNEHVVEYGQIITFVWECENPYRLCLSNGHESMDVTHIDSIILSVMFDCYELILYNEEGKIADKKTINIQYKKIVYCINCGNKFFDVYTDNYCTKCGVKIFHGN